VSTEKSLFAKEPREQARAFNQFVRSRFEVITPSDAMEWLGLNTRNRKQKERKIVEIAREIRSAHWKVNGESIIFGASGRLLDGQNRLMAIVRAEGTVVALVVRGIPDEFFLTIDTGVARTGADVCRIAEEPNSATLAAGLSVLWRFINGTSGGPWHDCPTRGELLDLLAAHEEFRASVQFTASHVMPGCPPGITSALHYLFSLKNRDMAERFFLGLLEGENLKKEDPVYSLRNKLIANARKPTGAGRLSGKVLAIWIVAAWNSTRKGGQARTRFQATRSEELIQMPEIK
jgi:hypothetical protein